jgi:hypothetical protein
MMLSLCVSGVKTSFKLGSFLIKFKLSIVIINPYFEIFIHFSEDLKPKPSDLISTLVLVYN